MSNDIPDIREFCFGDPTLGSPDTLLAIWVHSYLDKAQFSEFKRMIHEMSEENPGSRSTVEQMVSLIEMAKFLAED